MGVFTDAMTTIDGSLITVINSKFTAVAGYITPMLTIGLSIYVILIALSFMQHTPPVEMGFIDMVKRVVSWGIVISIGLNASTYSTLVVPAVNNIPNELAGLITNNVGAITQLDALADKFVDTIITIYSDASGIEETLLAIVTVVFLALFGLGFIAAAAALIIYAKVALALLLVLGPLFIGMALFPATKQFASSWVAQILTHMLTITLLSIVAFVEIEILTATIPSDIDSFSQVFTILLLCIAFIAITFKLPDMAAVLSGGLSLSGGFTSMGRAARSVRGSKSGNNNTPRPDPAKEAAMNKLAQKG